MLFYKHNETLPNLKLSINGHTIDQVTGFNFLGLHLNSQLTWHTHIEEISKKISRVTGIIYKMQNIPPSKFFLSLYFILTLILPHINYCILSWHKENDVITFTTKTCRSCYAFIRYRSHSEPLFKFYNLLKIDDIYTQRLLVFYYNVINKIISSNFNNFIPEFSDANNVYPIRNP